LKLNVKTGFKKKPVRKIESQRMQAII